MSNLSKILTGRKNCKSVWFMRQAGRYLPEFRKIRSKNKNFIQLCLNSELSSKITLQPIKRFDLDSAIIFSDILLVPYALGQNIVFKKDLGPKLSKFDYQSFLNSKKKKVFEKLSPVYKSIEITRKKLDKSKSLISFVGAPWTLLIYMLDLKKNKSEINIKNLENKKFKFKKIIDHLVEYLCLHIKNQMEAGADVVQIFDSWAGLIPNKQFNYFCLTPNFKIVKFCKKNKIPCICFPKGIKEKYKEFNNFVNPDGISIDSEIDPTWAKKELKDVIIQGGLNPKFLLKSENTMLKEATKYIETFKDVPYVFNLGHGLLPETDPDKVDKLIKFYRNFK